MTLRSTLICCLAAAALAGPLTSCATTRSTTTARTAVEEALLSQSAEQTVAQFDFDKLAGRKYFIETAGLKASDPEYIAGLLNRRLLAAGALAAKDAAHADVLVYPRVGNDAIDDTHSFIGIPALPVALPGIGGLTLPEFALFSHDRQMGRNRMFVNVVGAGDGVSILQTPIVSTQRHYDRWTILIFLGFRTTDLGKPF